jgi:hypothetical protein
MAARRHQPNHHRAPSTSMSAAISGLRWFCSREAAEGSSPVA